MSTLLAKNKKEGIQLDSEEGTDSSCAAVYIRPFSFSNPYVHPANKLN
jgi:hypothetical protein